VQSLTLSVDDKLFKFVDLTYHDHKAVCEG